MELELFRSILKKDRRIVLEFNSRRYKAKKAKKVLFAACSSGKACGYCQRDLSVFVVQAKDETCFRVEICELLNCNFYDVDGYPSLHFFKNSGGYGDHKCLKDAFEPKEKQSSSLESGSASY